MTKRRRILADDLPLLGALLGKEGTIKDLSAMTSLDKELVKRRVMALKGLGLISTKPGAARTYVLTPLGHDLAETKDIHLVEPYSLDERMPPEIGFRFAVGDGLYTGDIALSYRDLAGLIGKVDSRSLVFHLYRGDFERWVTQVFGDEGRHIALKLRRLASRTMPPDHLRSNLVRIFSTGLMEGRGKQGEEAVRMESPQDATLKPDGGATESEAEGREKTQDVTLEGEP